MTISFNLYYVSKKSWWARIFVIPATKVTNIRKTWLDISRRNIKILYAGFALWKAVWALSFEEVIWQGIWFWYFPKCRRKIAVSLNDFINRWCERENVEPDALKEWKINIFKIIDTRISFYSRNTHLLPPKSKSSFRHLKRGTQDFYMNYVLVPADKRC